MCNKGCGRMGSLFSYLWWGAKDPDATNPETGLSIRDIHNVRTSWAKVTENAIASGTELLIRFFQDYPQHKQFFSLFKNTPNEELRANRQFQAHSLNIMSSITQIVDNLDKPDLAIVMCKKLGVTHRRHHVKELQFNDIKEVLVKMFMNDLHFNEATMKSWVRCVTFIYTHIFKELEH